MTKLLFRDAVAADVPVIVAMYADDDLGATREQPGDPLPQAYRDAFEAIAADPRHRLIVVEDGGEIVATFQLSYLPQLGRVGMERAQIEAVRVASHRRGEGLGGQVFRWAIEEARGRGCGILQLTTDAHREGAHRFYERLGFVASHVGMKLNLRNG